MTTNKRKKVIKMRGSAKHGYGSKKKHRGKGSQGGKGRAGAFKQKKTWLFRYDPNHIGKSGFKSLKTKNVKRNYKSINLRDLEKLIVKIGLSGEINLRELGYEKVLASGKITKPLNIKAPLFSKRVEEKLKEVGGKIESV